MTGYGAARFESDSLSLAVEVRAVNNKYLKVSFRAPEPFQMLESEVEKLVRQSIRRGTLQIQLRCEQAPAAADYRINATALESYLQQLKPVLEKSGFGERGEALLSQALSLPGVVAEPLSQEARLKEDWPHIEKALGLALEQVVQMRRDEGKAMEKELLGHRRQIQEHLGVIEERIPNVTVSFRERLFERVQSILNECDVELDRSDLIKEVSIFSERSDIAEEVMRLGSHLDQFQEFLSEKESTGRKLEFLTQEMMREANTIGAKASDVAISRQVVEIKAVLEKIRELVQNIE